MGNHLAAYHRVANYIHGNVVSESTKDITGLHVAMVGRHGDTILYKNAHNCIEFAR